MTRAFIGSIEAEFRRYKALAEAALEQAPETDLSKRPYPSGNSLAILCWHVSGNLRSRFTDFLTTDGEKPWRQRDEEFVDRVVTRGELLAKWHGGWDVLFATLAGLTDTDLQRALKLRGRDLAVHEALHRALAHVGYHVGQIVLVARSFRGDEWRYLSIPPGQSDAYNANPATEKPHEHEGALRRQG